MEATAIVARTRVRVPMVWPNAAIVRVDVADLRGEPRDDAELVDQAHFMERLRVLGSRGEWRYVQGDDHYFGWVRAPLIGETTEYSERHVVATLAADVHERPARDAAVIARLPVGTWLPAPDLGPWHEVALADPDRRDGRSGFVSRDETVGVRDLPHRPPTATDLIRTAEAFLGAPYLWGGTSAAGIDCSGYVQQVYRLNGMGLDRDADQQATLGRSVDRARPGDLLFFGAKAVTHVALSLGGEDFLNAPQTGAVVERGSLGAGRNILAIRRYLMEEVA